MHITDDGGGDGARGRPRLGAGIHANSYEKKKELLKAATEVLSLHRRGRAAAKTLTFLFFSTVFQGSFSVKTDFYPYVSG